MFFSDLKSIDKQRYSILTSLLGPRGCIRYRLHQLPLCALSIAINYIPYLDLRRVISIANAPANVCALWWEQVRMCETFYKEKKKYFQESPTLISNDALCCWHVKSKTVNFILTEIIEEGYITYSRRKAHSLKSSPQTRLSSTRASTNDYLHTMLNARTHPASDHRIHTRNFFGSSFIRYNIPYGICWFIWSACVVSHLLVDQIRKVRQSIITPVSYLSRI
jgi:hypothetical protein